MKVCPICKARCFDDMERCFGCMHIFDSKGYAGIDADPVAFLQRDNQQPCCLKHVVDDVAQQSLQTTQQQDQQTPQASQITQQEGQQTTQQEDQQPLQALQQLDQQPAKQLTQQTEGHSGISTAGIEIPLSSIEKGVNVRYQLVISLEPVAVSCDVRSSIEGAERQYWQYA